jgi:carbon monoxide dehydrogenase subunit G
MDMTGQRTLQVTQQQAWEALNDPEILKACIPGCQKFEPAGDQKFVVAAGIKMGPVSALFNGHVQLTDIVPPESYKLNFDAQGGVAGFGKGESSVHIKPLEKGCELHYTVHSSVGGKIAQLGQRLIDGVAKNMAEDFFKRFEAALEKRYPAAQEVMNIETAPNAKQEAGVPAWLWAAAAAVVVAVVVVVAR